MHHEMCDCKTRPSLRLRTWEGWLYLAVVMDLYSRRIVGWSTKPTMARELVLDAILMAVRRRKPKHTLIHPIKAHNLVAMHGDVSAMRIILNPA